MNEEFGRHFGPMLDLLTKVHRWWILNVEIETDPDWDGVAVDPSQITPGSLWLMRILMDVALGNADEASRHLEAFKAAVAGRPKATPL
jgi:hypothetical protein